jgi:hypothetical protein
MEVGMIADVFSQPTVMSYPPMSIIVGQAPISAGWGSFFNSGTIRSIGRPVTNRGLALMVFSQRFCCNEPTTFVMSHP